MKALKLSLFSFLIALVSAFTFSSCLDNKDSSNFPMYSMYVTITGDDLFGYTFYADNGSILIPTTSSVKEVLPGLSGSNIKRALVSFDLASETENNYYLESGKRYDIILRQSYYSNYSIPTFSTIDVATHTAALDSLTQNNDEVNNVDKNIWAINGYVNASITLNYDYSRPFYMHTFYDSEKDVNVTNNTLYLNLYYNNNTTTVSQQGNGVFSFKLPEEIASTFNPNDSVELVLRAVINNHEQIYSEVGKCKLTVKDFYTPGLYY